MEKLIFIPPVLFFVVLALVWLESRSLDGFAFKPKKGKPQPDGKLKSYACGENVTDHRAQPEYSQFFHFAFFFTIMHVVALIVATVPAGSIGAACLAALFLISSAVGLFVLFRR